MYTVAVRCMSDLRIKVVQLRMTDYCTDFGGKHAPNQLIISRREWPVAIDM
jgi:hypothetical protein